MAGIGVPRLGKTGTGMACPGTAGPGKARRGTAQQGWAGTPPVSLGEAEEWQGLARRGLARQGQAGLGCAWLGMHGQGKAGTHTGYETKVGLDSARKPGGNYTLKLHTGGKEKGMRIRIEMTGKSPLVMHNAQLSDPLNEWVKLMAPLNAKRKKTEEDHEQIGRLEYGGSLYVGADGRIVMPTDNLKRCFVQGAKLSKKGKAVERALLPTAMEFPVAYKGPQDAKALADDPNFRFRTSVRVGASRVQRTRPRFRDWQITSEWELQSDLLDLDDLKHIVGIAGSIEGLGDHRTLGSGRFEAKVSRA